jgi:hypothetical protein
MFRIHPNPTPERLAIGTRFLFAILSAEALALFALRLAATLQFDKFAFFDTGSNLTVQYLIGAGYRPTIDFFYPYGLLPLWLGRTWFRIFGFTPIACIATVPLIDVLIVLGFVRLAANLKLNLAGVLIIVLTASLTIPSSFPNLAHGIEPIFLVHSLADQAGGNRRRALALAATCLFVKPSMAYFLGLILIAFMVIERLRIRVRALRLFFREIYPAALVVTSIAAALAVSFGPAAVLRSLIPTQGLAIYRAQGFGFFNSGGQLFLAPRGTPWSYYFANVAGPWIAYTIVLSTAGFVAAKDALGRKGEPDSAPELILTCALLHLSFIFFFFGNESSWIYYFYIPVIGLATAARLGMSWEILVACLAFAIPSIKADKGIMEHLASSRPASSAGRETRGSDAVAIPALPGESGFAYQLWFTTSPSAQTANLWVSAGERKEWMKTLALIRGHRTALLEYAGCGDLLFSEFSPPVTFFLLPGVGRNDLSRKLAQLQASSMVVMARSQNDLLHEIPEIGTVMRRDFVAAFEGDWFIVYARRGNVGNAN